MEYVINIETSPSHVKIIIAALVARSSQPATKYQKSENRGQKTDVPASNRLAQRAIPYATSPPPVSHPFNLFNPKSQIPNPQSNNPQPDRRGATIP